jgi:hypothetical protein
MTPWRQARPHWDFAAELLLRVAETEGWLRRIWELARGFNSAFILIRGTLYSIGPLGTGISAIIGERETGRATPQIKPS